MKRKVHELAEADRHEEAQQVEEELHRMARELDRDARHQKMVGGAFRGKRDQLTRHGDELRAEIERLGDGSPERGEELRQALPPGRAADGNAPRTTSTSSSGSERGRGSSKCSAEAERLAKAGRGDEAERVEREARKLARELERDPDQQERRRSPERGDIERRLEHLRIAVDNLHAAGLHDQAEELARAAERLVHPDRGPGGRRGGPERQHGPALEQAVDQLHHQMAEMRGPDALALQQQLERLNERRRREAR